MRKPSGRKGKFIAGGRKTKHTARGRRFQGGERRRGIILPDGRRLSIIYRVNKYYQALPGSIKVLKPSGPKDKALHELILQSLRDSGIKIKGDK